MEPDDNLNGITAGAKLSSPLRGEARDARLRAAREGVVSPQDSSVVLGGLPPPAAPRGASRLPPQGEDDSGPCRRCILTGTSHPRETLIRLALGPDGQVAADLGEKLPGRGAWISPDRSLLEKAMGPKGKLRGALARAFRASAIGVADDLPDRIAQGLERRALDRLGLENRAGHLIWGHERIGEALLKGRVRLLLHALDAAADGTGKLEARRRGASPSTVSMVLPVPRAQLSVALGRENVVHAAIADSASAARVIAALTRWQAFTGGPASSFGDPATDADGRHNDLDEQDAVPAVAVAADGRH